MANEANEEPDSSTLIMPAGIVGEPKKPGDMHRLSCTTTWSARDLQLPTNEGYLLASGARPVTGRAAATAAVGGDARGRDHRALRVPQEARKGAM
jgi:hypothetical protein